MSSRVINNENGTYLAHLDTGILYPMSPRVEIIHTLAENTLLSEEWLESQRTKYTHYELQYIAAYFTKVSDAEVRSVTTDFPYNCGGWSLKEDRKLILEGLNVDWEETGKRTGMFPEWCQERYRQLKEAEKRLKIW